MLADDMITIYALCYNEIVMLPHFLKHWKVKFPNCKIIIYDNESNDGSKEYAESMGCEVRTYKTDGKLSDKTYLDIKNNCWKDASTEWVAIVDVDEHVQINECELTKENDFGATIINFFGWNMVNLQDNMDFEGIDHAVRAESYDKFYIFKKSEIKEINYRPGAHRASPIGKIAFSEYTYDCHHYKYFNPDYMVKRHAMFSQRCSEDNIKRGYGGHYHYPEERIRKEFSDARKQAIRI